MHCSYTSVKALGTIKPYVKRFKKLVKFFTSSPKQTERLNNAQLEISVRVGHQQDLGQNNLIHFQKNQKYNKKNDNKSFKRHMSTENIGTDNNNSLASIDELQNEITKLKRNRNSYNVLMT
ncbi:10981_t:CDS:2, partial [Entrophospora sp. SA101]